MFLCGEHLFISPKLIIFILSNGILCIPSYSTIQLFVHQCTEQVEEAIIATINQYDTSSKGDWFLFRPFQPEGVFFPDDVSHVSKSECNSNLAMNVLDKDN